MPSLRNLLVRRSGVAVLLLAVVAIPQGSWALVEPDTKGTVGEKQFVHEDLNIATEYKRPKQLPPAASAKARAALTALSAPHDAGQVDIRSGRFATVTPVKSMVPGKGVGNKLDWEDGKGPPPHSQAFKDKAWGAFRDYLGENAQNLEIDMNEIGSPLVTIPGYGDKVQIYAPRVFNGVPVRGSYMSATMSQGNLILFGSSQWGDIDVSTEPTLTESEASSSVQSYAQEYPITGSWKKSSLTIVPKAKGHVPAHVEFKKGYSHSLAWVINPIFENQDVSQYEALVDAHTGEILSLQDTVDYFVCAGVYPVTNDGIVPDGVEQPGWPMPYDEITINLPGGGTETTDSGGNYKATGSVTSTLSGPYVRMNDNCGSISLTSTTGEIDFGTSGGTDCTTPGSGGAGNTHASRTGFYEINKIKEMARGQLPGNSWLWQQLTSNMNINNSCNAYWNGSTINFYRHNGSSCANTGEIAGVFDHEWGHGMDANDATPGIASPSGEGIADIYTALRLNDSCIGRNFQLTPCSGNGDPCLTCTGVRDIDYMKRQSQQPHDYTWSNANCGGSVHCVGGVYSEAVWSLWKRKLQQAPYNVDNNSAHEIVTRLTFFGAGATGTWFSGGPPNGGCASTSGYMNYLAADDDNGNLNDGTPHMTAIYEAFNDQEIACQTPTVQDSGCSGTPTSRPSVTANPLDKGVSLSWPAVAGASRYEIFRTEGVFGCDFGKVKIASTTGTSFDDSGLQNGRDYSYIVIPKGSEDSCFGPASTCATVSPAAGPNLAIDPASASESITTGDVDDFIDNCEEVTVTFDILNTGLGILNNVRITNVVSTSHSATIVDATSYAVTHAVLAQGSSTTGSFDFTAGGLAFGDTLMFEVTYTADELMGVEKKVTLNFANTETDLQSVASKMWDFETDQEGWTVIQGTFGRATAGGGAGSSVGYLQSSANLDNQCDQVRSTFFRLTAASTLEMFTNYDIENFSSGQWWDRANVGIWNNGARTVVIPDGGRTYNAQAGSPPCSVGDQGWANSATTWASSTWSAANLGSAGLAGQAIQLDVAYGTDPAANGYGLRIDKVTVTDVEELVADTQSNTCSCRVNADCDDGLYCNGAETCIIGACTPGIPPDCDDGVGCTDDSCNEATDTCDNIANNANCDDGKFCNGVETCDAVSDCQPGIAPDCDDSVACTDDSCDLQTDMCVNTPNNDNCPTGESCNGSSCVACNDNGVCDDGENCNTCPSDCIGGTSAGAVCGNGVCEAGNGEDCVSCSADCNGVQRGNKNNRYCCGDGDGDGPIGCGDPRCTTGGWSCTDIPAPTGSYCCGDKTCEGPEDSTNCLVDCPAATTPAPGGTTQAPPSAPTSSTSCGRNRDPCGSNGDPPCCSGSCVGGSCRGNGRLLRIEEEERVTYNFTGHDGTEHVDPFHKVADSNAMHGQLRGACGDELKPKMN